jgi:hypothetical protein
MPGFESVVEDLEFNGSYSGPLPKWVVQMDDIICGISLCLDGFPDHGDIRDRFCKIADKLEELVPGGGLRAMEMYDKRSCPGPPWFVSSCFVLHDIAYKYHIGQARLLGTSSDMFKQSIQFASLHSWKIVCRTAMEHYETVHTVQKAFPDAVREYRVFNDNACVLRFTSETFDLEIVPMRQANSEVIDLVSA